MVACGLDIKKAPRKVLERLSSVYSVNLNWLIHGKGPSGLESETVEIQDHIENPAYEPRRYSGNELEEIRVEGRVVACWHKI